MMKFKDAEDRAKGIAALISEIETNMSERDFQRDFFESLCKQFQDTNRLSDKQIECLEKMYGRVTDICPRFKPKRRY